MLRSDRRLGPTSTAVTFLVAALMSLAPALASEAVPADAAGRCESPRAAIYTLLYWLQPERTDPGRASLCVDTSRLERPAAEGPQRAARLKRVLDARGLYVVMDNIPSEGEHVEEATGQARHVPFPKDLPELVLVKQGERWVVSADTIAAVPDLYAATFPLSFDEFVGGLPAWLQTPLVGLQLWQLAGLLLLIFVAISLRRLAVWLVGVWLHRAAGRLKVEWVTDALHAADRPLGGLVIAGVVTVAFPILQFPVGINAIAMVAARVLASFSVVWLGYRQVDVFADILQRRAEATSTKLDDQLIPLVRKSLKVFLVVVGTIFVLQNLDVDVGSLLAGLGIGGLAFALAAKDTVANFFGSVMIFVDRPFQIGDWVKLGSDIEGTVEEVGFRTTRIRTFYNSLITVPNARMTDSSVDNLGARRYRRYSTVLSLTYDTPPERIDAFCEGVRAIIQALPGMRKDYDIVEFKEFGAHSLDVMLYCFMDTPDWLGEMRTRHNLNLAILQLARELGVEFAFPTQTLHLASMPAQGVAATPEALATQELAKIVREFGPHGAQGRPPKLREAPHARVSRVEVVRGEAADG